MVSSYHHTQRGPFWIVLVACVAAGAAGGAVADEPAARVAMTAFAVVFAFLALSFATLTVSDCGDHLRVRYGPLPLLGTTVPYAAVRGVRAARSRLIDGLGIHWAPGRGWTYSLWGFDCVEVTLERGRLLRIGTDDQRRLEAFLASRCEVGRDA